MAQDRSLTFPQTTRRRPPHRARGAVGVESCRWLSPVETPVLALFWRLSPVETPVLELFRWLSPVETPVLELFRWLSPVETPVLALFGRLSPVETPDLFALFG
uniref:hypothetical protein n=1 Tax=Tessaracoccus timonensis TaxID=2161816 RepID=UPI00131F3BCE|nr:hypothetical protein [Tessaracoccus timonensis]